MSISLGLLLCVCFCIPSTNNSTKLISQVSGVVKTTHNSNQKKSQVTPKQKTINTFEYKTDARTFIVTGVFSELSTIQIKGFLKDAQYLSEKELETYLLNTGIFKEVHVKIENDIAKIQVIEYPLLSKFDLVVEGAPKPKDLKQIQKNADFLSKTHVTPKVINDLCVSIIQTYGLQLGTKDVTAETYYKMLDNNFIDITISIKIKGGSYVGGIRFIGLKHLSEVGLRSAAKLSPRILAPLPIAYKTLREEDAQQTANNITAYAQANGFLDFKVKSITLEPDLGGRKIITVIVDEGEVYKLEKVKILTNLDTIKHRKVFKTFDRIVERNVIGNTFKMVHTNSAVRAMNLELVRNNLPNWYITYIFNRTSKNKVELIYNIHEITQFPRIRKINFINNTGVRDSTIMRYMYLRAGDILSPCFLDASIAELKDSGLFENVDFKIIDTENKELKDIEITFVEKSKGDINAGLQTNSHDVLLNGSVSGNINNLFGTGYKFSANAGLGTTPTLQLRFDMPFLIAKNTNLFFEASFKAFILTRSGLFGPSNSIEALFKALLGTNYGDLRSYISKLADSKSLQTDHNDSEERELLYLLSPYWEDKAKIKVNKEIRASLKGGIKFDLGENHDLILDLTFVNRKFEQNADPIDFSSSSVRAKKAKDEIAETNRSVLGDGSMVEFAIDYSNNTYPALNKEDSEGRVIDNYGNIVLNVPNLKSTNVKNYPALDKSVKKGRTNVLFYGLGENPVLREHHKLSEKAEIIASMTYIYSNNLYFIELPYNIAFSLSGIFGTTQAAKAKISFNAVKEINDYLSLELEGLYGYSFNNHYLDNFTFGDANISVAGGPIEVYDFTQLGGRSIWKLSTTLNLNLLSMHIANIIPYIRLTVGSVWDSGIEPKRVPDYLCLKRNWEQGTLDVQQNGFGNVITVVTPGVKIKIALLEIEIALNLTPFNQNSSLNRVSGLNMAGIGGLDIGLRFSVS